MASKLKKGDKVIVIAGSDKGKTGEITSMLRDKNRVVVSGVHAVTRHTRPTASHPGGLVKKELPIHASNVALLDKTTEKPTRVGYRVNADKTKVRIAKRSGNLIE